MNVIAKTNINVVYSVGGEEAAIHIIDDPVDDEIRDRHVKIDCKKFLQEFDI